MQSLAFRLLLHVVGRTHGEPQLRYGGRGAFINAMDSNSLRIPWHHGITMTAWTARESSGKRERPPTAYYVTGLG